MSRAGVAASSPWRARSLDLLVGRRLDDLRLGATIVLTFSGGRQVLIENAVHLTGPTGRVAVRPDETAADILATLLGDVVRTARTGPAGELVICFAGGAELTVGVDHEAEAWAVTGPGAFLLICLAGGELAAWGEAAPGGP